ncbi:hypothetical protein QBZ16_000742 [Prototheca wickerhamii]|uniref:Exostosin GT47 domain-containing protein n=1 Tax=Prototheca wickerhamii TaxID=3111 RepID=A0AAD9IM28_PROWI|nr:hypothetical protein QBZ16_000742 [Prototheca wickerhamii]
MPRILHATGMLEEAQNWIQVHYPYWDRKGGRDHIWEYQHPLWLPKGHLRRLTKGPCYDPSKDLLVPAMHSPDTLRASPLMGKAPVPRTRLAIFKGRMQFHDLRYSRGTRQRLAKRAWQDDWDRRHGILVADHGNKTRKSYSELMASSVFCLAIIGDGWTTRVEDAMLHGCIPVLIMDGVDPIYANLINETDISSADRE